jgi:hypothetical protein
MKKLVRLDKPVFGSLHICVPEDRRKGATNV